VEFPLQTVSPFFEAITIYNGESKSVVSGTGNMPDPVLGTQITVSEGHPWPPPKGSQGDIGGDFDTIKKYVVGNNVARNYSVGPVVTEIQRSNYPPYQLLVWFTREVRNNTPVYPLEPNQYTTTPFPVSAASSDAALMKKGADAVSKCKPTNSVSDLASFLGEFYKDGIPKLVGASLWQDRSRKYLELRRGANKGSDEYLNVAFGWLPFLSDISNTRNAILNAEKILSQYERDAGKQVRRQFHFPSQTIVHTETVRSHVKPFGFFHSDVSAGLPYGDVVRTDEIVRNVWFKGAFTYHLPTGYSSRNQMIRAAAQSDRLFGIAPTPEVIWNLTPWSWAIDWFSNLGNVISNISDMITDGLVMRYGYIMEHTVSKSTYTFAPEGSSESDGGGVSPLTFVTETKKRRQANPFGFGLNWDGLTPRQLAIAAALGIRKRT